MSESLNLFLKAYNDVINNQSKKINPTVLRTFNDNANANANSAQITDTNRPKGFVQMVPG